MLQPTRFTLGCTLRGLTKQELARRAHLTPRSLTAFENGAQVPSSHSLVQIARALRLPLGFFDADTPIVEIVPEAISFRALTRTTAAQRDQGLASAALAFELAGWISERFDLPAPDIPQYPGLDPETAALALRSSWGLGEKPISNMVHLLEAHGVRVFSLIEECYEIDAFSVWHRNTPFVFFNTMKSAEHGRFDAAHELGHLVLHHDPVARLHDRTAEHAAQQFASCFLMPERSIRAIAPLHAKLSDLILLKQRWRVSLSALVYRLHRLELLTEWEYRSLYKAMGMPDISAKNLKAAGARLRRFSPRSCSC